MFFLQIEESVASEFDLILTRDNIPVDMESALEPLTVHEYIENWRL